MKTVYARAPVQPAASVALMVKLKVPDVFGVPASAPFDARVSPPGNAPALTVKLYDPYHRQFRDEVRATPSRRHWLGTQSRPQVPGSPLAR